MNFCDQQTTHTQTHISARNDRLTFIDITNGTFLLVVLEVVFVGEVSEGPRSSGRSTSAQNRPFSAISRNSVTRTCPPPPVPTANTTLGSSSFRCQYRTGIEVQVVFLKLPVTIIAGKLPVT